MSTRSALISSSVSVSPTPCLPPHPTVARTKATPAPCSAHYVRDHGPIPRSRGDDDGWATWTVEVSGLVQRPVRLTVWGVLVKEDALHVCFEGADCNTIKNREGKKEKRSLEQVL